MAELGESRDAAVDPDTVDRLNAEFYGEIRYPWAPRAFERVARPDLWARLLAQDVGFRRTPVVAPGGRIWVAGCGTNQAVIAALQFPLAHVIGSDLSEQSLAVAAHNARQLGVDNLELRRESINTAAYRGAFDYVLCTGVIHHNAEPAATLAQLAAALRPTGVLELMVYNRFHRVVTAAFQAGVRALLGNATRPSLERELPVARKLIAALGPDHAAARLGDVPDAAFADALLQPVEHSYTIESLDAMARACELRLIEFCLDPFSRAQGRLDWNLELADPELCATYEALPDVTRWQITNLLLDERSPMLWFYLQRSDSPIPVPSQAQVAADMLTRRFVRNRTEKQIFVADDHGGYTASPKTLPFPSPRALGGDAARVYEALDDQRPLGHTIDRLGISRSFTSLHRLRIKLATSAFPYLLTADDEPSTLDSLSRH